MTQRPTHNFTKQTRNLTLVLCLGMLAGVLIWAKLRLVTDIPRSAYADPNEAKLPQDGLQDHDQNSDVDRDPDSQEHGDFEPISSDSVDPAPDSSTVKRP